MNLLSIILLLVGIALDIAAVLVLVLGAVIGIKKGGVRAGWKLVWRLATIVCSAIITVVIGRLCTSFLSSAATKLAKGNVPERFLFIVSDNKVFAGILMSAVLPFLFLVNLLIVSLIFLIPKILIWDKAIAPAYRKHCERKPENAAVSAIFGAILNAAAALLLFFAIIMPFACAAARTDKTLKAARSAGLTDNNIPGLSNPIYKICDAVMGNTLYKPLTSFRTVYGSTDFFSEAEYSLNIYGCMKNGDDYESSVRKANLNFRKSKLLPDIVSGLIVTATDDSRAIEDFLGSDAGMFRDAIDSIENTYDGVRAGQLRDDADALFSLISRMQISGFLSAKTKSARSAAADILLSEDSLKDLCKDLYRSERAVIVTEDTANSLYNQYMSKMLQGTDIPYTENPFKLRDLSSKEAVSEISDVAVSLQSLNNFSESVNAYNNAADKGEPSYIKDVDMGSLGKALDIMKNNKILASCYNDLMNAAENAMSKNSDSRINVSNLIKAANEAESSERYLGSAQGIAGMGEILSDKTLNDDLRNEMLTESVDILINNIDTDTASRIGNDIADVLHVEDNKDAVGFITEYTKQVADEKKNAKNPFEKTDLNAEKDAKAMAAIYALLEHSGEEIFSVSDSELSQHVQSIVNSDMITRTMDIYAKRGDTLGIAEALSEDNKSVIVSGLRSSGAPSDNIQAAIDFLKLNYFF